MGYLKASKSTGVKSELLLQLLTRQRLLHQWYEHS